MIVLISYALANLAALILFFRSEHRSIHVLEVLTYWLVSTILYQNYSAFFFMNIKYMVVSEQLSLELAHLLNRIVLYPVFTLIYVNRYAAAAGRSARSRWTLCAIVFFVGLEWLEDWLGILQHTPEWQLWWTLAWWCLYVLILLAVYHAFRIRLMKELAQS